ncbi:MAG TPA: ABC-F family ATP-binding cassette domain-containing protein [Vicinamibacterales bacterium]
MSLLQASGLAFRHPSQPDWLFNDVSFNVSPGDRIGLVGPNGSGKTSLLQILSGQRAPSAGRFVRRAGLRITHVRQEVQAPDDERLLDFVLNADAALTALRREVRRLEACLDDETAALRYADRLADYESAGGFALEVEVERVLEGLGFDHRERTLPVRHLSSGQRARATLARALAAPADLLLMDEPTNHLDSATREWLERWLSEASAACVIVSHDRGFLDAVTGRTFELRAGRLTVFEGAFAFYREQRTLLEHQAWERYEQQQRRSSAVARAAEARMKVASRVQRAPAGARHGHDFYQAKAARVQRTARILRERIVRAGPVEKPRVDPDIPTLDFAAVRRSGGSVLTARGLSKAWGGRQLFAGLSLWIGDGERLAVTGPNGSGKTTLLRVIAGLERPDAGVVTLGTGTRIGYFSQEGEHLDPGVSPLAYCLAINPDETWVRTLLACLRVRADQVRQPIGQLSGGERAKVALAALLVGGANLLLLDEPTNHLDIDAREALERTLVQFPGALIVVSHDERFVGAVATDVRPIGTL